MNSLNTRIWIGAIIMLIGGMLLLDNFVILPLDFSLRHLIFSWHTIFIIVGAIIISNNNRTFWGYLILGIGIVGILKHFPELPFFPYLSFRDLWPLILLGLGLWMIINHRGNGKTHHKIPHIESDAAKQNFEFGGKTFSEQSFDIIDEVSVLTNTHKLITSQNFKGGKSTTIFGGTKLDLAQAKLAPGENILEVTALFGGVNIRVPREWKVIVNVSAVFGGFDDKRFLNLDPSQSSDSILIIKGAVIFGGGELLN